MKIQKCILILCALLVIGCSSESSETENPNTINNPDNDNGNGMGEIDKQDTIEQNFTILRIGASDPNEEDIVAVSGLQMPLSGGAYYNNINMLNKTVLTFFGTIIDNDVNGVNLPNYPGDDDKSYKTIAFYLLSQQDINNGLIPNGKLIKNTAIEVSNNIGNDLWGGSMSTINAGSYTFIKTDDSIILGNTSTGETITKVAFNDVSDNAIIEKLNIYMDRFVTNLGNAIGGFTKSDIINELQKDELDILIIETVNNISGKSKQHKYTD